MARKYVLCTLGCKVNQYESQQVRELLHDLGWRPTQPGEQADLAVVNTCAVTSDAMRKNRRSIRRAGRGGRTPVIVVGCGASADAQQLRRIPGVRAVLGHDAAVEDEIRQLLSARLELPTAGSNGGVPPLTDTAGATQEPDRENVWMKPVASRRRVLASRDRVSVPLREIISTPLAVVKTPDALLGRIQAFEGHQRAFLKVQDGCDAHCSYCIIPQLRPRLRSKPIDAAIQEARQLVQAGYKEIVVTGIFLGAYGRSTAIRRRFGPKTSPLADLVAALAGVEGLARIRLSSLEPGDVDDALLEVLATRPNCVPHLHLPIQSGSADILRKMNRQYTAEDFAGMIDRVRSALDKPAITTDLIVGFPGEGDGDFEASIEACRHAQCLKIHAFPFSARPRTAAARWQRDFVAKPVVQERMRRLAELERQCSLDYRRSLLGRTERVIVELPRPDDAACSIVRGRADRYFEIWFESAEPVRPGRLLNVRIDRVTPTRTHGIAPANGRADHALFILSNSRS